MTAMVVDGNTLHRELLQVFLETMGFSSVVTARAIVEAKETYQRCSPRPSVLLVAHDTGPFDGIGLMKELKGLDPSMRVVVMSRDPTLERECLKEGADSFIKKPFSIAEIGRVINMVMRASVVS